MNYYETLYIVHPALETGRLKDIILSLEESLHKLGGKTLSVDIWGKKRLAYLIDKQKYGTYVQLQFTGEGDCISNFGLELNHNSNVLSYLTTLIEEADVVEQENDLDTQIAGQSRESQKIDSRSENADKKIRLKDSKSAKNNETSLVETEVAKGTEEPVEKSGKAGSEEDPAAGDDVKDHSDKLENEEIDVLEKSTASVEENPENVDETATVSEEEK